MRRWQKIFVGCCSAVAMACGGSAEQSGPAPQLSVRDAWARPADSGATSAVYFTLGNSGSLADTLTGLSSDDAEATQMHVSTQHGGMMHMSEITALPVPADDSVLFKPLGAHVMLLRVGKPLTATDSVSVLLTFVSGQTLTVRAGVRQP